MPKLASLLERAYTQCDPRAGVARDPVRFVHRYANSSDREIAGVFASQLAYGRVGLFGPVLESLFDILDDGGGPAAFVDGYQPGERRRFDALRYRFNRPVDWALMVAGLQRLRGTYGSLAPVFSASTAYESLTTGVGRLTRAIEASAGDHGVTEIPRGTRYWLANPDRGSACKRWNLFLRWMVRPPIEGVDLGIWTWPKPAALVMPVDTHVFRIAGFLGLTERRTTTWSTAIDITRALARLDPTDPVRFDFAIAHLGISGACQGRRIAEICSRCPLEPGCEAPTQ